MAKSSTSKPVVATRSSCPVIDRRLYPEVKDACSASWRRDPGGIGFYVRHQLRRPSNSLEFATRPRPTTDSAPFADQGLSSRQPTQVIGLNQRRGKLYCVTSATRGIRRIPEHESRDRYLIEARLLQPMLVADIRRPQIENLVAAGKHSPRLSSAPNFQYDQTRHWAQRLFDHLPGMCGMLYESQQVPGDCIIVFWGRGNDSVRASRWRDLSQRRAGPRSESNRHASKGGGFSYYFGFHRRALGTFVVRSTPSP